MAQDGRDGGRGEDGTGEPPPAGPPTRLDRSRLPLPPPAEHPVVEIDSHTALMRVLPEAVRRVAADPAFSVMLLINPVLALERYGIRLSPALRRHVLHVLQHPPRVRERREALEASLAKALGEAPRPNDPRWMAKLLFAMRRLAPLETKGQAPAYRAAPNAAVVERLKARLPPATSRYEGTRRIARRGTIRLAPLPPFAGRLDLAAPAPALPAAAAAPEAVMLEEAWFYKDLDPLVRDAVELGTIQRRGLDVQSPDSFRRIGEGQQAVAFRSWIRAVRLKDGAR